MSDLSHLSRQLEIGSFAVNLTVDADGHLSIYVKSNDGSPCVDITDDMGADNEICVRVTTQRIENGADSTLIKGY